mgnify:CR=1 FL=1
MLPLLLTLTTWGRDHPAAQLPAADDNEDGLILVVGGELSAPPVQRATPRGGGRIEMH